MAHLRQDRQKANRGVVIDGHHPAGADLQIIEVFAEIDWRISGVVFFIGHAGRLAGGLGSSHRDSIADPVNPRAEHIRRAEADRIWAITKQTAVGCNQPTKRRAGG